jgi:hypothetical protein
MRVAASGSAYIRVPGPLLCQWAGWTRQILLDAARWSGSQKTGMRPRSEPHQSGPPLSEGRNPCGNKLPEHFERFSERMSPFPGQNAVHGQIAERDTLSQPILPPPTFIAALSIFAAIPGRKKRVQYNFLTFGDGWVLSGNALICTFVGSSLGKGPERGLLRPLC